VAFNKSKSAIILLAFLHLVGFFGICFSSHSDWFVHMTPANLLITAVALFSFSEKPSKGQILLLLFIFTASIAIEVIGVATAFPFGHYKYLSALGYQVWDVPLIIGLNWVILAVASTSMLPRNYSLLLKALLAASLMVVMDYFIEAVAPTLSFWIFSENSLLQNYIAWWIISFVFCALIIKSRFQVDSLIALSIYTIQLLFFVLLTIFV
jgi:putative membrane protein